MPVHFEELWEQCENLQKEASENAEIKIIIDELVMKLGLYKMIDTQLASFKKEEGPKIKALALGEILLTLTSLSIKDNINVFEALATALSCRTVRNLDKKKSV